MIIKNSGDRGFSLFELIVVMVIIGLGAALVSPRIGAGLESLEVKAAARKIIAAMRYARNTAVYNSCACQIIIDIKSRSVVVEKVTHDSRFAGMTTFKKEQIQLIKLSKEIELNIEDYSGIDAGNGIYQFIYFPSGYLRGGNITIKGHKDILEKITTDVFTGFPRIEG